MYLLGGRPSKYQYTTERLDSLTNPQWVRSFNLRSKMDVGCTATISDHEVVTIAGNQESTRVMHLYNIRTGVVTKYNTVPPTPVSLTRSLNIQFILYNLSDNNFNTFRGCEKL